MNTKRIAQITLVTVLGVSLVAAFAQAQTPLGTAFTYQGKLTDGVGPVTSTADFNFYLYDSAGGNCPPPLGGVLIAGPITATNIDIADDGTFSVDLNFGDGVFLGAERWLEFEVRAPHDPNDNDPFTTLCPRQPVMPAPYALFALNASSANWVDKGGGDIAYMDGNIGIGVSPPAQLLHVAGDSVDSPTIVLQSTVAPVNEQAASVFVDPSTGDFGLGRMSDDGLTLNRTDLLVDALTGNVGIGDDPNTGIQLHVRDINDIAVLGVSTFEHGVMGVSNNSAKGGVHGLTYDPTGYGVYGLASENSGANYGVYGQSNSPAGWAGYFAGRGHFSDSLLVGRENTINGSEYFGVEAPVGNDVYGGMFISTSSATAWPFYGYATGGVLGMWHYYDGGTDKWHLYNGGDRITVDSAGNVGIGTTDPDNILHVAKGSAGTTIAGHLNAPLVIENSAQTYISILAPDVSEQGILFGNPTDGVAAGAVLYNASAVPDGLEFRVNGNNTEMVLDSSGNVGIGTSSPIARLNAKAGPGDGVAILGETTTDADANAGYFVNRNPASAQTALYCRTDGTGLAFWADGTARVDVLEITGADLAEKFPVSDTTPPEPGTVMAIDPQNPGQLCLARGAYNRCVAGVVSGAGNLSAGTILGNLPGNEDAPPIALSGRVWVQCDTSNGSIQPGDLLTTSITPGHAMKVTDFVSAQGAIIGKAMTPLDDGDAGTVGTGLVLVLVGLQ